MSRQLWSIPFVQTIHNPAYLLFIGILFACSGHICWRVVCDNVSGLIFNSKLWQFCVCYVTATRPLLRQIENLQATYSAQSSTWERIEKNLSDRLSKFICMVLEEYSYRIVTPLAIHCREMFSAGT